MTDAQWAVVERILRSTAQEYRQLVGGSEPSSQLCCPPKGVELRRDSEQEFRFLLCRQLELAKDFYYSVESPTRNNYGKGRRGNVDVSLWQSPPQGKANQSPVFNLELKSSNPTAASIRNDLNKLAQEPSRGIFCLAMPDDNWQQKFKKVQKTLIDEMRNSTQIGRAHV